MTDNDGDIASVQGRGEVQLGPIDLLAKIGISLGNLEREAQANRNRAEMALMNNPVDTPRGASGVYPDSGTLVLNLGQPERFRYWEVRRLVVGGQLGSDTPAGTGLVYATPAPSGPLTVAQLRDFTSGDLPQVAFYGRREMIVRDEESLLVEITGGTSGTIYTAVAAVDDWPGQQQVIKYPEP